jgi:hypothetical protein
MHCGLGLPTCPRCDATKMERNRQRGSFQEVERCAGRIDLNAAGSRPIVPRMTAKAIVEEISDLAPDDQARAISYALELARSRQLPGAKLSALTNKLAVAGDPAEVLRLKDELTRGFYGT